MDRTSKSVCINQVVTIKFYYKLLKKRGVHTIILITSGKQISNEYKLCLDKIGSVVIPSYT